MNIPSDAQTVSIAARIANISRQSIWKRIKRGSLPAWNIPNRYVVSLHDIKPKVFPKPETLSIPDDAVTLAEAARQRNVARSTMTRSIQRKAIPYWKIGTLVCVSHAQTHLKGEPHAN